MIKWKNMKKSTKIGLVSSMIYTASALALPAFANNLSSIDLDGVQTFDQANQLYHQTLAEYAQDKKISTQEVKNLYKIVEKGAGLEKHKTKEVVYKPQMRLETQIKILERKQYELIDLFRVLDKKISQETDEFVLINKKAEAQQLFINSDKEMENLRKGVDDLFFTYYPGFLNEDNSDCNLQYSAKDKLIEPVEKAIPPLIRKADQIFQVVYQKNSIEFLLNKELTLHDIAVFRNLINSQHDIKYTQKDYELLKKQKLVLIQQLEQKKAQTAKEILPKQNALEKEILILEQKLKDISKLSVPTFFLKKSATFEDYLNALEKRNEFIGKHCDAGEYWTNSMILEEDRLHGFINVSKYDFQKEVSDLERLLKYDLQKEEGVFQIELEDIKNPSRTKFPLWLTWPGGMVFVALRDLLIGRYVIKRDWDPVDLLDPLLIAGILGPLFFDGFHPLVYPIRLFAMPFVMEPFRKLTGMRDFFW